MTDKLHTPKETALNELCLSKFYVKRPSPSRKWPNFDERIRQVENDMWWDCARAVVGQLDNRACPAAWTFVVWCSDFWHFRNPAENPAAMHVTYCPDFMKTLSCGHYTELFGRFDMGEFEYRKKHPRKWAANVLRPRRSSVENDLMMLWRAATTDVDKALPLSKCESGDDVAYVLRRARKELNVKELVDAYVKGVDADILAEAKRNNYSIEKVVDAVKCGVPIVDLFAGTAE